MVGTIRTLVDRRLKRVQGAVIARYQGEQHAPFGFPGPPVLPGLHCDLFKEAGSVLGQEHTPADRICSGIVPKDRVEEGLPGSRDTAGGRKVPQHLARRGISEECEPRCVAVLDHPARRNELFAIHAEEHEDVAEVFRKPLKVLGGKLHDRRDVGRLEHHRAIATGAPAARRALKLRFAGRCRRDRYHTRRTTFVARCGFGTALATLVPRLARRPEEPLQKRASAGGLIHYVPLWESVSLPHIVLREGAAPRSTVHQDCDCETRRRRSTADSVPAAAPPAAIRRASSTAAC
ncbi:hypothetical protein BLA39750_01016 [Burkholderia lata]|uniref:Uncharacterized protein n=1 Tax=Burkholderia lata (strain ATCC 17760 / DSM 23089 / LMG 22485 / NCIMB 9086 / R18194 / 383) TaxID=482957 RepID=A0A6P2V672_BURL3|nr:hypothetical protein BLA39750_01016 [Burkholderia lata]